MKFFPSVNHEVTMSWSLFGNKVYGELFLFAGVVIDACGLLMQMHRLTQRCKELITLPVSFGGSTSYWHFNLSCAKKFKR